MVAIEHYMLIRCIAQGISRAGCIGFNFFTPGFATCIPGFCRSSMFVNANHSIPFAEADAIQQGNTPNRSFVVRSCSITNISCINILEGSSCENVGAANQSCTRYSCRTVTVSPRLISRQHYLMLQRTGFEFILSA